MTMKMKSRDDSRRRLTLESSISSRQFRATAWGESDKRRLLTEDLAVKKAGNQYVTRVNAEKFQYRMLCTARQTIKNRRDFRKKKTLQKRGLYLTHPFALTLKSRKGGIAL